jgi:peptidoglycan/xylan/chitin deacetylase (PgdA/CDA1 family)/glycosyltransferase involved in cell wall biosynthesis
MSASRVELSIIVPTHNRRERVTTLLGSLARQTEPPERFEVVVVADGSSDGTEEALRNLELPFDLIVVSQEQRGVEAARNHGVSRAGGRLCLFLDDDMVADSGLVAAHLRANGNDEQVVGIGRLEKLLGASPPRWARARARERRLHYQSLTAGRVPSFLDSYGGNLSVPRDLYLQVGGFAEDLRVEGLRFGMRYNDLELGYRLQRRGANFRFIADAFAEEDDTESLREYVRDCGHRGASSMALWARHPAFLANQAIGGRADLSGKWNGLLRLVVALRVPPLAIGVFGSVLPDALWTRGWSRLLFLSGYWQGVRATVRDRDTWARLRSGTTILTYHAIGGDREGGSRYVVPVRRFKRQMGWLRARGYVLIDLSELADCIREYRLPPAKAVVITFDDGYQDSVDLAVPILEQFGYPATFFLVSAAGSSNGWSSEPELSGRALIGVEQARDLAGRVSIGAHTRTHPRLTRIPADAAREEVEGSKAELEESLGIDIALFSYPYGNNDEEVRGIVADAGFSAACTTVPAQTRPSNDPLSLNRFDVRGRDSILRFAATLWLHERDMLFTRLRR